MKKEQTLMIIAVWVILLPNLGFPPSWRKILLLLTGLCIGFIAYSIRNNRIKNELAEMNYEPNKIEEASTVVNNI